VGKKRAPELIQSPHFEVDFSFELLVSAKSQSESTETKKDCGRRLWDGNELEAALAAPAGAVPMMSLVCFIF